jgi:hypothetical protein
MTDMVLEGFADREFSVEELTTAMNVIPNNYGLVTNLGIFGRAPPLATTNFKVERQNYELNLLPFTERGAPGTEGSTGKRDVRIFEVPQITHRDHVKVADLQNLRAFGSFAPKMMEDAIREKLVTMANKHFITHEYMRCSALQGKIIDADGTEVLNYYTEFGVTQPIVAFTEAGSTIAQKLRAIHRQMEDNLLGETMTGIGCLASSGFMETLFADTEIKSVHNASMAAGNMLAAMNPTLNDLRYSFRYMDINFMEYRGSASVKNANGTVSVRRFIPTNEAIFFPIGTQMTAHEYIAPGDFLESLNMPGELFYAKEAADKHNRSREILTQSNFLPMWKRPALLVRGTIGSSGTNITV